MLQRAIFKAKAAPADIPPKIAAECLSESDKQTYKPDSWEPYFDTHEFLQTSAHKKFSVYRSSGGIEKSDTIFVLLHGAGHTALSWSLVAKILKEKQISVLTYDMRGHGKSEIEQPENENNFDVNILSMDAVDIICSNFPEKIPSIVLVGHSMGGCIAAHIASGPHTDIPGDIVKWKKVVDALRGVVVVDVVEGTALESLPRMKQILNNRPEQFSSVESAVQWVYNSNLVKSIRSARISVPPQVIEDPNNDGQYIWRTNLLNSEEYWESWFTGLSKKFLSSKPAKLLILAGTDRLDTELTIAQMQGKFQLVLLPQCGHSIQEDDPTTIAEHLIIFKNRFS